MKKWAALLAFLMAASGHAWDLNDVSILLPLSPLAPDFKLSPDTLALLPQLVAGSTIKNTSLSCVGIRLDPCFLMDGVCQPQIRLIWQPMVTAGTDFWTMDAAAHSFYALSDAEFTELKNKLAALNASPATGGVSTRGLPLQVHPILAKQGYTGPYWRGLRSALLPYLSDSHLVRVTFMSQDLPQTMWTFGGFDLVGGKATRMVIPRVLTRQQSFINKRAPTFGFQGGAKPEPQGDVDTMNQVLTLGDAVLASAVLRAQVDSAHRIENPRIHDPSTMDCVSCHTAQAVRGWATTNFPVLKLDESPFRFATPLSLDLSNTMGNPNTTEQMRMFGYNLSNPQVANRVIHESAAVVEALSH